VNLNSPYNTNNLEEPGFVFLYWFLDTKLTGGNSGFNIFLDLFKEFRKKVTVFGACLEQAILILTGQLFEKF
jgi:hypothetical protein